MCHYLSENIYTVRCQIYIYKYNASPNGPACFLAVCSSDNDSLLSFMPGKKRNVKKRESRRVLHPVTACSAINVPDCYAASRELRKMASFSRWMKLAALRYTTETQWKGTQHRLMSPGGGVPGEIETWGHVRNTHSSCWFFSQNTIRCWCMLVQPPPSFFCCCIFSPKKREKNESGKQVSFSW